MNDLKRYLDNRLGKVSVSPELKDKLLQKPFVEQGKPLNPFQIAAIAAACLCLLLAIPLVPAVRSWLDDNRASTTISTTTTETTTTTTTTEPTTPPPEEVASLTGDLDGDGQPDLVSISHLQGTETDQPGTSVLIEVFLASGRQISETISYAMFYQQADCIDTNHDGRDELLLIVQSTGIQPRWERTAIVYKLVGSSEPSLRRYHLPQEFEYHCQLQENYTYTVTMDALGQEVTRQYRVNDHIRDFYNRDGTLSLDPGGSQTYAVDRYEIGTKDGQTVIRLYQAVFGFDAETQLGEGVVTLRWEEEPTPQELDTYIVIDQQFLPIEQPAGPRPSTRWEKEVQEFLEAWKNKDAQTVREYCGHYDLEIDQILQDMDISGYRFEKEDPGIYTVYLDIEKSKVREFPPGKNRKYTLVCHHSVGYASCHVIEFSPAGQKPVYPTRGKIFTGEIEQNNRKNKMYVYASCFVYHWYERLETGPIEIDTSKEGYDLAHLLPDVFEVETGLETITLEELKNAYQKMFRIKNLDPNKISHYDPETGLISLGGHGGVSVTMNITKVKQAGKVYTLSIDIFADPICAVVATSLDLTIHDNGDGTYFFDTITITYTSPYPIWSTST